MRKIVIVAILALTFSIMSTASLLAAPKPALPKIDIKKITLQSEEKGAVPSGTPLLALVDVNASEDVAGPFAVNLELKKGQSKQAFKEGIEKLNKGVNSFKWDLAGKPEDGLYVVSVEITSRDSKVKDRFTKSFRVGEKPAKTKTEPAKPQKKLPVKIDIKKITLQSEEKGAVPSGTPLLALVDVNASEDVAGPFAVNLELKKGQDKKSSKESIEKLNKGSNSFKWSLAEKPEDGQYVVSTEITSQDPKLKERYTKSFRVGEKKTPAKPQTTKTETTAAKTTKTTKSGTTQTKTTKSGATQTKTTKSGGGTDTDTETTGAKKDDKKDDKKDEEDEKPEFSGGLVGGDEEEGQTHIEVTGQSVKRLVIAGVTLNGNFTQRSPGVWLVQGEIKPEGFPVSFGRAAGELIINTNTDRIEGQMSIKVAVLGEIVKITDLILSKTQLKFKGKVTEKLEIPVVNAEIKLAEALADFEISSSRLACTATGGAIIEVSIPKVGKVKFEVATVGGTFNTSLPPEGVSISGKGTVTIPFEPPIKVDLTGSAEITKQMVSGTGSAALFKVLEIGNAEFKIKYNGLMTVDANIGAFMKDYGLEANVADTLLTVDLPKRLLTGEMSQSIKILDLVTIPGSVKGKIAIDGKARMLSVSGNAKVPLTGTAIGPDEISAGIENFLFKITNYDDPRTRQVELNGDLAVSIWTLGGFNGKITGTVLDGRGNFYLPPGLKQLLDTEKISLPVKIDLKSAMIMGELGGDIAGLAIKHFPLTGPKIIVKNDGVHLKGEIGIANVITIPLGDLVFKQDTTYTTIDGDIGIGPFTVAEGKFTLPAKASDGIGFSGKMGIPGLTTQKISGTIYKEGNKARAELSGVNKIGPITMDTEAKYDVSQAGLHADRAEYGVDLGGAARCALIFTSLDINKVGIKGRATGTFTNVLGVNASLRGDFSFDGQTVELSYPDTVSLCGIKVNKAKLFIRTDGVTGTGTISAGGKSTNITITIENGIMKLRGPAGKLIAEGMRIADKLYDTASEIASEEKETITEHGGDTLDNLSRMTDPWVKEVVAAARAVKGIYNAIEEVVVGEVTKLVKSALDDLKMVVDAAVTFAKSAIAAAVDAVCNGIIAMVNGVTAIFAQIESIIPDSFMSTYNTVKAKVIQKANAVKAAVVTFRDNTKAALYDLTGTITAIYQAAIDQVTDEANSIAAKIKKELDPAIKEIDVLLTEIGEEIDAATSAAGDEAERHYAIAKQKAGILKTKADAITSKYKDKIGDLVAPYAKPVFDKIASQKAKVTKERDAVVAKAIDKLGEAKKALDPVMKPFEDSVKELRDIAGSIGGEVYKKFLNGLGAAGDDMNAALGAAGKGLVKATDVIGDAAVAVSGAAANASEAVYNAAAATVNFVQDTGSQAVNVAVDTAQEGYQTAAEAASQAAAAAQQAASQAYNAAASAAASAQKQVTTTINTVISNLPSIPPSVFITGAPISFSDIQSGAATISVKVSAILSTLDSYATSAYNTASSAASSVGSAVSSGASTVASGVSSRWKKATGKISNLWGGSDSTPAPTTNYTAPEVMNVAATSTTTSATITYNTSFNSRTIIFYSATPTVNLTGQNATTAVASVHSGNYYPETTSHTITISGLTAGTTYYYIIYAVHAMSNGQTTNAAKRGTYTVVTQPSTAIIGGLVKDAAGSAISGAKIYLGQGTTPVVTTDATGRYTLEVNPGAQTVTAKKDNYLNSSTTTASLTAGQVLPLDFKLADGRIHVSGTVKDAETNTGISSATVTLTGLPTQLSLQTAANGTFTTVLGTNGTSSATFTITAAKVGYTPYISSQIMLAPGAKMQNIEIKLPRTAPVVSSEGVRVLGITATQATVSFTTTSACSAFVQLGLQPGTYTLQTPAKTNMNSFYFDLVGLSPSTAYKYKVVLQDSFGNTVVAKESAFTTASAVSTATDIGVNATISNITANSVKLNITSAFNTLKYQLVLRDTTANTQISNQDLGLLVSPVKIDLANLKDGHNYTVDLTGSLLANVTTGGAIKTSSKSVSFQVPALKSVVIKDLKVDPDTVKRGTTTTINVSATVRINHAVTGAVLKVFADTKELYSQSLGNLSPGEARITVPLAVSSIPGTGAVAIKFKVQAAGNIQEGSAYTIDITAASAKTGGSQATTQNKTGKPAAI